MDSCIRIKLLNKSVATPFNSVTMKLAVAELCLRAIANTQSSATGACLANETNTHYQLLQDHSCRIAFITCRIPVFVIGWLVRVHVLTSCMSSSETRAADRPISGFSTEDQQSPLLISDDTNPHSGFVESKLCPCIVCTIIS